MKKGSSFPWIFVFAIFAGAVWMLGHAIKKTTVPEPLHPAQPQSTQAFSSVEKAKRRLAMAAPDSLDGTLLQALESIQSETDPMLQEQKLQELAAGLADADIPAWVKALADNASPLAKDLQLRLLRRWTQIDSRAAAQWASHLPAGESRQAALGAIAVTWADHNLSDATQWALQMNPGEEQQKLVLIIASEAARTDSVGALKLAAQLPQSQERDDLIARASSQWANSDPEAAAAWAKQIPNETLRDTVLAEIATAWGESDPASAAKMAIESLAPGKNQDDAIVSIVQRWAQSAPEKAAAWVLDFPAGTLRDAASENLIKLWADKNPEAAGQWVNTLAPGTEKDAAMMVYINQITTQTPQTAAAWTEKIQDQSLRNTAIEKVAEGWLAIDPRPALDWIAQTSLPESEKAKLRALSH